MIVFNNRYIPYRNIVCFLAESAIIFVSVIISHAIITNASSSHLLVTNDILIRAFLIAFIAQFCMYMLDLYDLNITLSFYDIFFSVVLTTGFIFIVIGILILMIPGIGIEGNMYYLTGLFFFVLLLVWRTVLEIFIKNKVATSNVIILGAGEIANEIEELILNSTRLGFNFIGFATNLSNIDHENVKGNVYLDICQLKDFVRSYNVNNIVVAPQDRRKQVPIRELLSLKIQGVRIIEWPEFYEKLAGKIPVNNLPTSYFVFNEGFNVSILYRMASGLSNFVISIISLILCLPLFIVVPILIKLDSRGPVFYFQERIGKHRRTFKLIKFRTMIDEAENGTGAKWAEYDDPRITRLGKYLRKYRIDEFPQMINVLKRDMDLIGPRPERPEFVMFLEEEIPYYGLRHFVNPGITGWAQVKFFYSSTTAETREKLAYDLFYIKNRSFKLDLYILFKTVKVLLLGRGSK